MNADEPLFCNRCLRELIPGVGDHYVITIYAVADPTPPTFTQEDLERDVRAEIRELIDQLTDQSPIDLREQVSRRLLIYLCNPCYRRWIENPTAGKNGD